MYPDKIQYLNESEIVPDSTLAPTVTKGRLKWVGLATGVLITTLVMTTCINPPEIAQIRAPEIQFQAASAKEPTPFSLGPATRPTLLPTPTIIPSERFLTGVNMSNALSWPPSEISSGLAEIQKMDGKLVRVFIANNQLSDEQSARRLSVFLDKAESYNLSVIPSFIDFHGGPWDEQNMSEAYNRASCPDYTDQSISGNGGMTVCNGKSKTLPDLQKELLAIGYGNGYNPTGTDKYYIKQGNYGVLGKEFFISSIPRFKSFIEKVISQNKNHTNIYAWEVGNELRSEGDVFVEFMREITSYIRSLDPQRRIASGMADSRLTGLTPQQLYSRLPDLDVITIHPYDGDRSGLADVKWALGKRKIPLVEEIGFSGNGDRSEKLGKEITFWQSAGASGALVWGFSPNSSVFVDRGFTPKHTDYNQIAQLLKTASK